MRQISFMKKISMFKWVKYFHFVILDSLLLIRRRKDFEIRTSRCSRKSMTHLYTILLLSAYPRSVTGFTQTFTTINKIICVNRLAVYIFNWIAEDSYIILDGIYVCMRVYVCIHTILNILYYYFHTTEVVELMFIKL